MGTYPGHYGLYIPSGYKMVCICIKLWHCPRLIFWKLGGRLPGMLWNNLSYFTVLCITFQELLKKIGEEHLAVGGDTSGIHYPPLPPSDDEDIDENTKPIAPPPGFDTNQGGTNIPPPLLRR